MFHANIVCIDVTWQIQRDLLKRIYKYSHKNNVDSIVNHEKVCLHIPQESKVTNLVLVKTPYRPQC